MPGFLTRRQFLGTTAAIAGTWALRSRWLQAEEASDDGPFKLGLQSYSLRHFDTETALKQTSELGLKYWEAYPGHVKVSTVPGYITEKKAIFDQQGVKLLAFGVVNFNEDEAKAREIFDFAQGMGIQSISADPNPDAKTFDLLDKLVEEYQIAIAIHNHGPGHRYSTADDVLKVVKDRHALIGACVDTGHFLRSNEDPVEVVSKLGKRVFGVHLKDVRSVRDAEEREQLAKELPESRVAMLNREEKIFTILGEGELNIVGVLRELKKNAYTGMLSLEYEENPQNPLSDINLSLTAAHSAIRQVEGMPEK